MATEQTGQTETNDDGSMSLIAHLEELRRRLIRSLIAVAVGSAIAYFFIEDIMHWLTAPAGKLYYLQPAEAFFTYLKVAVATGFLLALPVVFYHVWRFFLPALTVKERMVLGLLVPLSVLLFFGGLAFSFYAVLPFVVKFFMGFGNSELEAMFSIDKYFDFIVTFVLPFGFMFELPLVLAVLAKMGFVTSQGLKKYFRYVIFISFVVAAMLTPPDVVSQTMLAIPLIALYGVGYGVVRFLLKK
ncbi:MAG: twin-arginine translocase subunit TatC [Selenomonadaceae bacterium]|nr:twin-arginine translocase subunit TatC [Selenomonadaceae bacterium]